MLHVCVERFDVMGRRENILGWEGEVNEAQAELEKPLAQREDKVPCSLIPQNRLIRVKLCGGDEQSLCFPGPRPRPALDAPPASSQIRPSRSPAPLALQDPPDLGWLPPPGPGRESGSVCYVCSVPQNLYLAN
jgi:hypothetical protein